MMEAASRRTVRILSTTHLPLEGDLTALWGTTACTSDLVKSLFGIRVDFSFSLLSSEACLPLGGRFISLGHAVGSMIESQMALMAMLALKLLHSQIKPVQRVIDTGKVLEY